MLLLEYAPIASISGIAWNPSHSASGYSVTFGSDKAGVSQLMRTLKSSKKFSVWVCSLLEYALVASILCNFQNPFHSASGYPVSSNGDELGAWRLISGPKFQKKGKNTWTTHEAIARWAQRGTRTRSLEIRSLARYHCASRARIWWLPWWLSGKTKHIALDWAFHSRFPGCSVTTKCKSKVQ